MPDEEDVPWRRRPRWSVRDRSGLRGTDVGIGLACGPIGLIGGVRGVSMGGAANIVAGLVVPAVGIAAFVLALLYLRRPVGDYPPTYTDDVRRAWKWVRENRLPSDAARDDASSRQ